MNYVLFNPTNGAIVQKGSCQLEGAPQVSGLTTLEIDQATADSIEKTTHASVVILNTVPTVVLYTDAEKQRRDTRPAFSSSWDYSTKQWVDIRTLVQAKLLKNAVINAARVAANLTTFPFAGHPIACDAQSRVDIENVTSEIMLTGAMPTGWSGTWKAADNVDVAVATKPVWVTFYKAMTALSRANFQTAQTMKATLLAATTLAQVDAIVVNF